MKTVCFTGHRPDKLGGYDENNLIAFSIKRKLTHEILCAYDNGYTKFIFGGALGIDTWAGELVAHIKEHFHSDIRLELYAPFEGQEGNWPEESKIRYYNLMSMCDKMVYICDPGYAAWKMQKRNQAMVDNSDMVIAVWDGTDGGTANCVKYAEGKDKQIIRINPNK